MSFNRTVIALALAAVVGDRTPLTTAQVEDMTAKMARQRRRRGAFNNGMSRAMLDTDPTTATRVTQGPQGDGPQSKAAARRRRQAASRRAKT